MIMIKRCPSCYCSDAFFRYFDLDLDEFEYIYIYIYRILASRPTTKKAKRSMQKTQYTCLLRHAKEGTPEAQKRANDFYHNTMKSCYTANSVAQNIMLQWCTSSEEMVEVLYLKKHYI